MKRTLMGGTILASLLLLLLISQGTAQTGGKAGMTPSHSSERPEAVYITDFEIQSGSVTEEGRLLKRLPRMQQDPEAKTRELVELLSATLTRELQDKGVPAKRLYAGQQQPLKGWLVKGEFLEVDEGNRLRRAAIGFGAGSTQMLVEVTITDLAGDRNEPFLVFGTGSKSGRGPGAVVMMNPYAAAAKFVLSKRAPEKDVKKAARQMADVIAKSFAEPRAL